MKRFTQSQKRTASELKIGEKKEGKMILPSEDSNGITELLSTLSEVKYQGEHAYFDSARFLDRKGTLGKVYLAARSVESISCKKILPILEDMSATIICNEDSDGILGLPAIPLSTIVKNKGQKIDETVKKAHERSGDLS